LPKKGITTNEKRSSSCCKLSCHSASASPSVESEESDGSERGDDGGVGDDRSETNEADWLKDSESTEPAMDEPAGV
jgi:hypothetical protein